MPSFDVVSEVDLHAFTNAVDQASRVIETRFDFKGVDAGFERKDRVVTLHAEAEFQLEQMLDILRGALTRCKIDPRAVKPGDVIATGTPGGVLAGSNLKVGLAIITNMKNDRKRREKFTEAQLARTRFLEPGDTLELSIKTADGAIDLGTQRNIIANA